MRSLELYLRRSLQALAGALALVAVAVAAPSWNSLSASQQAIIKPALKSQGGDFDQLPEARRGDLVRGADRWLAMSPEQRLTATRQFQQWQQLSMQDKVSVLERRERFRKLAPEQRKALLETQRQFLEMPMQQQIDLRSEFNELRPAFEGLPSQPFGTPNAPGPGATPPLGLPPVTGMPGSGSNSGGLNLPPLPR